MSFIRCRWRYGGFGEPLFLVTLCALISLGMTRYDDYQTRIKVVEGLVIANEVKIGITEYFDLHRQWPQGRSSQEIYEQLDIPPLRMTSNVRSVFVGEHGVITITYADNVPHGILLRLVPTYDSDRQRILWQCHAKNFVRLEQIPLDCRPV